MWDYLPCGFSGMGPFRVGHEREGGVSLPEVVGTQRLGPIMCYRLSSSSRTGLIYDTSFEGMWPFILKTAG